MQRSDLIVNRLEECIYNGEITEEDMLKIFNLVCDYLNMKSFAELAKEKEVTVQAVYKSKIKYIEKFNIKIHYDYD
jgi:hypothetical protein